MLTATRDDHLRADHPRPARDLGFDHPSRARWTSLTGMVQFVASLVGIPIALVSGYSVYQSNFSTEAKCQALRGSIISMLDRKADPSTLRLLMHRDVVSFERDCGAVDAEAVAAFKRLLVAERVPAEQAKPDAKAEAKKLPALSSVAKTEPKTEPKIEPLPIAKSDKAIDTKVETKAEAKVDAKAETKAVIPDAAAENAVAVKPAPQVAKAEPAEVDATWIASVREALRDSAARPSAVEAAPAIAAPLPAPVVVAPPPTPREANADRPVPPADIPSGR